MTTGSTNVTALNGYYNGIYEDTVFVAMEQTLATRLVKTFTNGQGLQTRKVSTYPEVSYVQTGENDDFSAPTSFTKTLLTTLTPVEFVAQFLITDSRVETDPEDVKSDAVMAFGMGYAKNVDSNILGLASSLTCGTVGAAGSTLTWDYFHAAIAILRGNNVPEPYYCVLHPYGWQDLAKVAGVSATVTNAPALQDEVMRKWWIGSVSGVQLFLSSNAQTSSTNSYGMIFNPAAIAFDLRRDLRIEPERDASKRGVELTASSVYAYGVWRANWGVQILHDITTPA